MRKTALISLFFLVLLAFSATALYQNKEEFTSILLLNGSFAIDKTGEDYKVENVFVDIYIIPKDSFSQNVLDTVSSPELDHDKMTFSSPEPKTYRYSVSKKLQNEFSILQAERYTPYREYIFPDEILPYLEHGIYSDTDKDIMYKTREFTIEKDYYYVVFNIARYLSAFEIDKMSPGNANLEKATNVFKSKRGDAIGINSLFISMLRTLNIPARLVQGLHEEADGEFVEHYWTEVYFPNLGFVPFDITNSQFGMIDTSHIKMRNMEDYSPSTIKVSSDSKRDANIVPSSLDYSLKILSSSEKETKIAEAKVFLYSDKIKKGSYNIAEIVFYNWNNFYLPIHYDIAEQVVGLNIQNDYEKDILLTPGSSKSIYLIITPDDSTEIKNSRLDFQPYPDFSADVIVSNKGDFLTKEDVEGIMKTRPHEIINPPKSKIHEILGNNFSKEQIDSMIDDSIATADAVKITKTSIQEGGNTKISIEIEPKNVLYNFSVYVNIPKCLAERIDEIVFKEKNFTVLNADPLVVWHFAEVTDKIDLSYELKDLKDIHECEDEALTLAMAEEIGKEIIIKSKFNYWKIILPLLLIPIIAIIIIFFSKFRREDDGPKEEEKKKEEEDDDPKYYLKEFN